MPGREEPKPRPCNHSQQFLPSFGSEGAAQGEGETESDQTQEPTAPSESEEVSEPQEFRPAVVDAPIAQALKDVPIEAIAEIAKEIIAHEIAARRLLQKMM